MTLKEGDKVMFIGEIEKGNHAAVVSLDYGQVFWLWELDCLVEETEYTPETEFDRHSDQLSLSAAKKRLLAQLAAIEQAIEQIGEFE